MPGAHDDPFTVISGVALLSSVASNPEGFTAFAMEFWNALRDDRCPRCGYKWTHPVAFLKGRECW